MTVVEDIDHIQNPEDILLSVCMITYCHQDFIAAAIEGVLMQQLSGKIEFVISDDMSPDGTREICQQYQKRYPDRIRLLLPAANLGMMPNFIQCVGKCRGKYIALCEGDDHWTDPLKLQKQVTALEADPEAVACFTNAYNERDGIRTEYLDGNRATVPGPRVYQHELIHAQELPTCTVLFRRQAMLPLPKALGLAPTGDVILYAHVSNHGYFIYLPDFTGVRHIHPGGVHSMKDLVHRRLVKLNNIPYLDEVTHQKHHAFLDGVRRKVTEEVWVLALKEHRMDLARIYWWPMARMRKHIGWNLSTTARNYLKAYWPRTEHLFGKAWDRIRGRP